MNNWKKSFAHGIRKRLDELKRQQQQNGHADLGFSALVVQDRDKQQYDASRALMHQACPELKVQTNNPKTYGVQGVAEGHAAASTVGLSKQFNGKASRRAPSPQLPSFV